MPKIQRVDRERVAPGLTGAQRKALLAKWKRQGRQCVYCHVRPASTVDHVVALIRGGTNFEGNLAPACRSCNSAKVDRTLMEWRLGKRPKPHPESAYDARRYVRPPLQPKPEPVRVQVSCTVCAEVFTARAGAKSCSPECRDERDRRLTRDAYRARVGLPVNFSEPTKPWLRRMELAA